MAVLPWPKRGAHVGKTKRSKGTKWMVLVDGGGAPLGAYLDAASPAEVTLLERTPDTVVIGRTHHAGRPRKPPERLVADRAYDTNTLRAALVRRGIDPTFLRARTIDAPLIKIDAACGATSIVGLWNELSHGWVIFDGSWCAAND